MTKLRKRVGEKLKKVGTKSYPPSQILKIQWSGLIFIHSVSHKAGSFFAVWLKTQNYQNWSSFSCPNSIFQKICTNSLDASKSIFDEWMNWGINWSVKTQNSRTMDILPSKLIFSESPTSILSCQKSAEKEPVIWSLGYPSTKRRTINLGKSTHQEVEELICCANINQYGRCKSFLPTLTGVFPATACSDTRKKRHL